LPIVIRVPPIVESTAAAVVTAVAASIANHIFLPFFLPLSTFFGPLFLPLATLFRSLLRLFANLFATLLRSFALLVVPFAGVPAIQPAALSIAVASSPFREVAFSIESVESILDLLTIKVAFYLLLRASVW
jgi:hypothetical protein